jgi:hypothetical protein
MMIVDVHGHAYALLKKGSYFATLWDPSLKHKILRSIDSVKSLSGITIGATLVIDTVVPENIMIANDNNIYMDMYISPYLLKQITMMAVQHIHNKSVMKDKHTTSIHVSDLLFNNDNLPGDVRVCVSISRNVVAFVMCDGFTDGIKVSFNDDNYAASAMVCEFNWMNNIDRQILAKQTASGTIRTFTNDGYNPTSQQMVDDIISQYKNWKLSKKKGGTSVT